MSPTPGKQRNFLALPEAAKLMKISETSRQITVMLCALETDVLPELKSTSALTSAGLIKSNLEELKNRLLKLVNADSFKSGNTVITNARHHENLTKVASSNKHAYE